MSNINTSMSESSQEHSSNSGRRVVITGLGIINPIGVTLETYWDSLVRQKSGIKTIQLFDASHLPTRFAGEVSDFEPKNYIDKKERKNLRVMARGIQMAVAAAQLALDDSGIDKSKLDPTRFGVEFASGLMASDLDELAGAAKASTNGQAEGVDLEKWGIEGIPVIPPLWMLKYLPNMLACHVSILHNAQGPNNTITESDVAGLLAIGEAGRILQRDQADFFLVGGADSKLNPLSMVRQCLFGTLSKRNEEPEKASRPFERTRDGLAIGEGSGVLAVEDLAHAQKRGAQIYAELIGFGASFDIEKSGKGLARAIRIALQEADLNPEEIGHINAHGMSLPKTDVWEAKGLQEAFGPALENIPVFAGKSYFGNIGAGSGTTELIASFLAVQKSVLPATLNYEQPDPECPLQVTKKDRELTRPYFLKVGFTDMGQCAALVFRKWDK